MGRCGYGVFPYPFELEEISGTFIFDSLRLRVSIIIIISKITPNLCASCFFSDLGGSI